ncbi:MAG: chemotaxis protein CheA [Desulfobacterales bacterium]|nr:MAG: chemotaxis protein CheA [Desulfobacterales bacterium]
MDPHAEFYLQEARENLSRMESDILDLEVDPDSQEITDRLFRSAHTIKGSGAMFGFHQTADFTHHLEHVLDHLREKDIDADKNLIEILLASVDHISCLLCQDETSPSVPHPNSGELIRCLSAFLPDHEENISPAPEAAPAKDRSEEEFRLPEDISGGTENGIGEVCFRIRFRPHPELLTTGNNPLMILKELCALGHCRISGFLQHVPALAGLNPEHCYIFWEAVVCTTHDLNEIRDIFLFVEDRSEVEINAIPLFDNPVENEPARIGDILLEKGNVSRQALCKALRRQKRLGELLMASGEIDEEHLSVALEEQSLIKERMSAAADKFIHIPSARLDALVDLIGELAISQARLNRIGEESGNRALSQTVEAMDHLIGEARECALRLRMLPVGPMFSKFRRVVRDISTELGKNAVLLIEGADTELDKHILDRLDAPLVHLLRNSLDHGIEKPRDREKQGKPACGRIHLKAAHKKSKVVISISDDGCGMDLDQIREKAVSCGILAGDAAPSEAELLEILFSPGFSTAKEVTDLSGRGVGLDVVRKEMRAVGGTVSIQSSRNQGVSFQMAIPLTMAALEGLLVRVGNQRFVVPLSMVDACAESCTTLHENRLARIKGELLPVVHLADIFCIPEAMDTPAHLISLSSDDGRRIAAGVDAILGNIQAVIKPLNRIYESAEGASAATILSDGSVALILDATGLVNLSMAREA